MSSIIHEVNLHDAIPQPRPEHIASQGPRRLVKLAPVMGGVPVIWASPDVSESFDADGKKVAVRICIVLVVKKPKPETMRIEIPLDLYDQLHNVPVEW